jgi:hypothetical protein
MPELSRPVIAKKKKACQQSISKNKVGEQLPQTQLEERTFGALTGRRCRHI